MRERSTSSAAGPLLKNSLRTSFAAFSISAEKYDPDPERYYRNCKIYSLTFLTGAMGCLLLRVTGEFHPEHLAVFFGTGLASGLIIDRIFRPNSELSMDDPKTRATWEPVIPD